MEMINAIILIIDDDPKVNSNEYSLKFELEAIFNKVIIFDTPAEALSFIETNLTENIIILLDLVFPQNLPNGHDILEEIRKLSFLIPVIIWSAKDEEKEKYSDLINNRSFYYLNKTASTEEIIKRLKEAVEYANNDVSVALESWINNHSDDKKEQPYLITVDGKKMTLNEILKEVRLQSEIGKHFAKQLTSLTIDLLSRNKEKLND